MSSAAAVNSRDYEQSHPWITFEFRLQSLSEIDWMHIGEALSKSEHIASVPLKPEVARELHYVYLAKGVHATTQIEGNTLSEEDVRRILDGQLKLPESQEYLADENRNIVRACNVIADDLVNNNDLALTVDRVKLFNHLVLESQPEDEGVVPGEIRTRGVDVGRVYKGVPAGDCEYLLDRLCTWLEQIVDDVDDPWRKPVKLIRAILAHLYLAWIHPFADGNGRTARLVEFQLLAAAGFPTPACHLLSNYYNKTRLRYYRALAETSRAPYPVERFVSYALRGFVEELREQLDVIGMQVMEVSWVDYVYSMFRDQHGSTVKRRRDVALALPWGEVTPLNKIRLLSDEYVDRGPKTVSRDVKALVQLGLIELTAGGIRPRVEVLSTFLAPRQDDA